MNEFNKEKVESILFLLERINDRKRFYFDGKCLYFSAFGYLCHVTDRIAGKELNNGNYEDYYEIEISEITLNDLLDIDKPLSLEKKRN